MKRVSMYKRIKQNNAEDRKTISYSATDSKAFYQRSLFSRILALLITIIISTVLFTGCAVNNSFDKPGDDEVIQKADDKVTANSDDRIVIALLDTGISTVAIDPDHVLPGHNYVTDSNDTEDRINHGTAVASVIVGCESAEVEAMAPDALLVPIVIADNVDGEAKSVTHTVLAQAVRDAVDLYGADIINLSLGIKTDVSALREAVEYAESKGVLVISAVGNEGYSDDMYYPAAYSTVLAVGSCDKYGDESDFSQKNGTADVLAPGEGIWLASRDGSKYGAKGTSYATGFVSAKAAEIRKSSSDLSPAEVRTEMSDMGVLSAR